ncbi:MAG TPA: hypothetical protein PKV35_07840, partial [bacterium]|nr:hypothetical protein [bacterium]
MRNVLIILILMALSACNSDKPKTDADINDKDSGITDVDTPVPDPDTVEIDTEQPDIDADIDANTDADTAVPCLDLRYNENTIKTNFPFKDKDGKPTFCRPGCDTPTETDPQCVRNIWEWDNWEEYQVYLEAEKNNPGQYLERECYPWPCKLPDMDTSIETGLKTVCDRNITVGGFSADSGDVWTHGMSDGVFGAGLYHSGRVVEYDPEKDDYMALGQKKAPLFFNKGRYVVSVFDSYPKDNPEFKSYVVSISKKDNKYYYEFIYDNEKHNAYFSRPPFVGKDWALIQVCEGPNGSCDIKYAKADNWEWHSLNIGKVQEGNIVDDRLSFIINDGVNDRQVFYCDMSKYPKSYNDCTRVTRKLDEGGYELGHSPRIDEDDKTRLIYYLHSAPLNLVEVKFPEGKEPEYREIKVNHRFQTEKVKGNLLMHTSYSEEFNGFMSCWYRFDKNKSYCPVTHDW